MLKEILKKQEERKNKRLLHDVMPLYASAMCLKNFGFKMYKHSYGRKERGIYIYPKESNWNDRERVFLSLDTFKGNHTDEEMEQIVIDLIKSLNIQSL